MTTIVFFVFQVPINNAWILSIKWAKTAFLNSNYVIIEPIKARRLLRHPQHFEFIICKAFFSLFLDGHLTTTLG